MGFAFNPLTGQLDLVSAPAAGGTVSDATTLAKGIVQLAGDLTGTAASPQLATTIGSSGTTGSSGTVIPVISYDAKGRITAMSSTAVAIGSNTVGRVDHGAVNSVARPTGYYSIEWVGSVAPLNATDTDTWIDTT